MKKILPLTAALCLGAILFTGTASAAILYSTNYTSGPFNVSTNGVQFDLSQFDPSLGTLAGVTFTIISSIDTGSISAVAANTSPSNRVQFNNTPNDNLIVNDVAGLYFSFQTTATNLITTPSITNGTTLTRGQSQVYTLTPTTLGSNLSTPIDNSTWSWSNFIGNSTISFIASTAPEISVLLNGGLSRISNNIVNTTTLGITYTYTVPEPSTYALLGLGGLALVVAWRRRVA